MTKAELVAHGTSPRAGVQRPLRGLSVYRSFSPSSAPSVYHCRPQGRRGPPTAGRHAGQPTDRHNGRRKGTGPTETYRNPGGGATRPISAARRPRAPPAGWSGAGEQAREGRPRAAPGAPERGAHGAAERANQRDGRSGGGRPNREPDGTQTGPGGQPAGGPRAPGGAGGPRQAPGHKRRAHRRAPRRGAGAQCAKSGGGPRHRRGSEGRSDPRSRPAHRGGCGHPRRALRRGGPRGPQTGATRPRDLARARAPGKARSVRLSGALSAQRADNVSRRSGCAARCEHRIDAPKVRRCERS